MDPNDPNNVGIQAKDSRGSKGGKKQPGKVANTDHYGNGGAGGETAVPGKKSGTEHLPEGRNGKESKAAENKAAGKSTPPANLAPLDMPPPKELAAPQLKKPAVPTKAKAGGGLGAKGKKGGDSNHVTGLPPAHNAPAIVSLTPLPTEPAKLVDVPNVAPIDTVVVAPPTNGKAHPLHDALRAEVGTLGEQIKAAHTEILSLSKQLEKSVAAQLQTYATAIDQRVQKGTSRVGAAYSGLSTAINAAVSEAHEVVTKREQSIPAKIKAVRDAKANELKAIVTKVKKDTRDTITKGPEAMAAKKTAIGFADKMDAMGKMLIAEIKTKTTEGGELSKGLNPKKYSDQIQFGGEGTRAIGHKALVEDKRLSLITTAGKSAIGLIEGTIATLSKDYREHSGAKLGQALEGSDGELDKVITQVHEPEQQKHLDAAATLATESLHKQVGASRTGIAKVQKDATTTIANERKSAETGAQKAGKALSDNIKHGAKEIESRIASKSAQDASSYNKLNGELKKIGKSKKLDAPTKARLDAMKADLNAAREQNKQILEELASKSIEELKRDKEKQYEDAIAGYEAAAAKTKTELVGKVTTATTQLGQSFDTIGTSFDATMQSETKKMEVDLNFYTKEAHALPATMQASLDKLVLGTEKGLREGTAKMLELETVQAKLNKKSEPMVTAAMKTGQDNAHAIWDAMDGVGTDENKIFGAMRTATPGEIVYIEAIYNAAYPARGTKDYPSPLQADLDDELSGSEWDIAFAYLRHQRERALKLELDDSRGIFNDEEERIEEVLKAASDDELKNILDSADGKATLERVKGCLSGCDLDVVNALTAIDAKTGMPDADRKIKSDAIRIYDAMYGGTGIGTEEDKIKKILESTTDPVQRQKLKAAYSEYIRKKDPLQAHILEQQSGKDADLLDASIDDEMSGGEWTETRAMSESDMTQEDHLKMVRMAKVVDGAHGAGTDEDKITDNIETDDAYFAKYKAEKDPQQRKVMAEGREKAMNARLRWLEGERVDENGQPLLDKDGKPLKKGANVMTSRFQGESITDILKGELGSEDITFEELEQGKWGPYPDRGDKNGQQVKRAEYQQRARLGQLNLEYMVAQRKLQAGNVDPELLVAYACWGVAGTDEANLKKGLKKGGELNSKEEIKNLRTRFIHCWGVDLMDGLNELERKDFKEPKGTVPSEVDGKDWLEIRISLMGRPETPQEIAYVDNVRYKFVTTGTGNTSPWSHAREDMEVNHKRVQDECAKAVLENKPLNSFDAADKNKKPDRKKFAEGESGEAAFKKAEDEFYASDAATAGQYMEENRLEILSGYAERSEMAFLTAKEAMADAIIMVVELIGAALITAASMGATSPLLAAFIGNMILAGMTIMMRKEMVGDAYGAEAIGIDVVKGIVMAAIAAAGEAKVVADFAKKAGTMGGKTFAVLTGGAEKAGMRVVGKEGLEVAGGAALRLEAKVGAKVASEGAEKAAVTTGKEVAEKVATKEAGDVAEKVATKGVDDVVEKAATKEATEVGEKAATKGATEVGEKVATKEAAAVAKKTGKEQVESAVESGTKNAVNSAMSESATFLMDEKTWEMKGFDAVFGENSLGRKLLTKLPSAFAQGAVSDYIQNLAHVSSPDKVRGPTSGSEATFRNILAEIGGNTAGFLTYADNYSDASTFWQELFKSNMQSIGSGALSGYLNHRQRAAKLGIDAHKAFTSTDAEAIASIKGQLAEADGYMETHEKQRLVDRILAEKGGADVIQHLPESFQKLAGKAKQTGADVTTEGGDKKANTGKTATEEKNEAATKKQAVDEEAKKNKQAADDEAAAAKKKAEAEAANKKPVEPENDEAKKKAAVVPEPEVETKKTAQQLAKDAEHKADQERVAHLEKKSKFDEIDRLATLATSAEDWQFIRQLEHEAGRPESERFSHDDKMAALQALARDKTAAVESPITNNDEKSTKSGAKFNPNANKDDKSSNLAGNETEVSDHTKSRAKATLDAMSAPDRKAVDDIMALATTKAQTSMLEKAIAAGRKPGDLEILRAAMAGMNDAEIAHTFSGAGVIQFFHQSCAPTAYQIAIADVDPFFAFYLRQHPELVMDAQSNALVINGGAQTKRNDLDNPKEEPGKNLQPHLDDKSMSSKLGDQDSYSNDGNKGGIDMPDLAGSNLHKALEKATGVPYEIVTNEAVPFQNKGAGTYKDSSAPHDRIIAAVQAGHPVIVGQYLPGMGGGHAMVIVGVEVHGVPPNRTVIYKVRDPMSGTVATMPQDIMDRLGTQGFTLPKVAKGADEHSTKPVVDEKSKKTGDEGDEKSAKTGAVDDDKQSTKKWDDAKLTEKPEPESLAEAHERRSQPVKPKNPEHEHTFASPSDRKGVANEVPLSRQELRDLLVAKYGNFLKPWLEAKHTSHEMWLPLIKELQEIQTGAGGKDKTLGPKYEEKFRELSKKIAEHEAAQGNKKELDDAQLRSFYNLVEKEDMRTIWHGELAAKNLPPEQVAKLMSMYREELKILVRDLMQDDNATEVLYQRDRIVYGDRRGPQFDDIFNKNVAKNTSTDGADVKENKAYKGIVDSSMRSNEEMNLKLTGYADGIDPEVGKKIRETSEDPKKTLPGVKAANEKLVSGGDEKSTKSGAVDEGSGGDKEVDTDTTRRMLADVEQLLPNVPDGAKKTALLADIEKSKRLQAEIDAAAERVRTGGGKNPADVEQFNKALKQQAETLKRLKKETGAPDRLAQRVSIEAEIGKLAEQDPRAMAAMRDACQKALVYLEASAAKFGHDGDKLTEQIGTKASKGYAGGGLEKAEHIKRVLAGGGTLSEMAGLIDNFQREVLATDMLTRSKKDVMDLFKQVNEQLGDKNGFNVGEILKDRNKILGDKDATGDASLLDPKEKGRAAGLKKAFSGASDSAYTTDAVKGGMDWKRGEGGLKKASFEERALKGPHELFDAELHLAAKSLAIDVAGKSPDDIRAALTAEWKKRVADQTASADKPPWPHGEDLPGSRRAVGADESAAQGEGAQNMMKDGSLTLVDGTRANVINEDHAWIEFSRALDMPMRAGLSGTTNRLINAAKRMGVNTQDMRIACLGYLLPISAHSYHEVMTAADQQGTRYQAGDYYGSGLDPEKVGAIIKRHEGEGESQ